MSRISRATAQIFGGAAAAAANGIGQFGSAAASAINYSLSLSVIQNLAAWAQGWANATLGASKFPAIEDMNAVDYVHSTQIAYLLSQGIPEYDAATTYYADQVCMQAGTFKLYGSVANNNTGNALSNPAFWQLLADFSSAALIAANNLSDLANIQTAVSNLGFVFSPGLSGYFKMPTLSGGVPPLIIQWGKTGTIAPGATGSVTFPIAFPNNFYIAVPAIAVSASCYAQDIQATSLSGFTLGNPGASGNSASSFWIALGN